ncbi:MAG TPA: hypothetical protein V6D46_03730, partial [Coleofasciculaceae cyanobacterium]
MSSGLILIAIPDDSVAKGLVDAVTELNCEACCVTSVDQLLPALARLQPLVVVLAPCPEADGLALCQQLRTSATGQHLPIVMVGSATQ